WLRLLSQFSSAGQVEVPYCTVGTADHLARHNPEQFLELPLRESLATVAAVSDLAMRLKTYGRARQGRRVTELLVQEMKGLCQAQGAGFKVAVLAGETEFRTHYETFCCSQGIGIVPCESLPMSSEFRVRGDGHPNGKMN